MQIQVQQSEMTMAVTAMRAGMDTFRQHAHQMQQMASFLREGGDGGDLWAPGENGARAADRMAEQFNRQVEETERLILAIEDAAEIIIVTEEF